MDRVSISKLVRKHLSGSSPTMALIYVGTLLLSLLSFFTTYHGLKIVVPAPLALLGSLGLQSAMLGIAWNLMRIRTNRWPYLLVFSLAASFSVFFSYANFNSNLKNHTRATEARANYAQAIQPVLQAYAATAKSAQLRAEYQSDRLNQLLMIEQEKGWATMMDEGSRDPVVQSVIDGARRSIDSWRANQGSDYRQGAGQGIISNYISTWQQQADRNVVTLRSYVREVDSLSLMLTPALSVEDQFTLLQAGVVDFPLSAVTTVNGEQPTDLPIPPNSADYPETPTSSQQALLLVLGDLLAMDHLTFFSLLFAFVIDFIVIVMALAGSHLKDNLDIVMSRVEKDVARRIQRMRLDDPEQLSASLEENLARVRLAGSYGLSLQRIIDGFQELKERGDVDLGKTEAVTDADPAANADGLEESEKRRELLKEYL